MKTADEVISSTALRKEGRQTLDQEARDAAGKGCEERFAGFLADVLFGVLVQRSRLRFA